ncbi:MAG: hypothetical protein IKS37_09585 [Solobacterium sp.]|jgi:cellobiose-specific phosphotransferase system component IIB|nr:hypothetical protein [Solobacterium sp.]
MIRIAICCGEGFASGFLSRHLAESTVKEHLQEQVSFIFIPYFQLYERQDEADIAMLMPHIEPMAKEDKKEYHIPLYIIPFKVVIMPPAADYLSDAEYILEETGGKGGLFYFPGEEKTAFVNRIGSRRKWEAAHK